MLECLVIIDNADNVMQPYSDMSYISSEEDSDLESDEEVLRARGDFTDAEHFVSAEQSKFKFLNTGTTVGASADANSAKAQLEDLLSPNVIEMGGILLENVLSHPFVMFRYQCQVNSMARKLHLEPFSALYVMGRLATQQGPSAFWKGLRSGLIFQGITRIAENFIHHGFDFPIEGDRIRTMRDFVQHLLLKGGALVLATPFYSSFVIDTVQSCAASDAPGLLDSLQDALRRMVDLGLTSGSGVGPSRVIPVWRLAAPMLLTGLAHYILFTFVKSTSRYYIRHRINVEKSYCREKGLPDPYNTTVEVLYPHILSTIVANMACCVALYPFLTVSHRLHIQGTRTIIDNTDSGLEVTPINTQYQGFFHAMTSIVEEETYVGLFRGFGAAIVQYSLQLTGLHFLTSLCQNTMPSY